MPRLPTLLGFLVFALIFALSPPVYSQSAPDVRVVRLGMVDGDVQVQHPAQQGVQQGWEAALANTPLQQGDIVATGNGVAEIEFENGATGYLGDNSALEFTELGLANSGLITRLSVRQGSTRFFVHVDDVDVFEIRSGGVSVSPRERADFRVDSYTDGVSVSVLKGAVSALTPQLPAGSQTTALEQGHMLSFHTDNPQALDVTDLPAEDQFDAWAAYNNAVMMENVNTALNYTAPGAPYTYSYALSELTRYGTWFNFPGYGWAWQPTVVNSEWVPFSNGIWRFAPHFGYCWISFDRWGWLPFHFGNWVHAPQGWAWIPGNFRQWQPATVGWVRVGNRVGWVPRAPGDQPNKLPGNIKYGVVTNPLETTTTVLRGPNHVLRNDEVKNARVISAPPSKLAAVTTAKSVAPFVVQPPMSRTPPFSAPNAGPIARGPIANTPVANTSSLVGIGSQAIVYDPSTHTYVNANPGFRSGGEPAIRAAGSSQPRLPRVGAPVGGATNNRVPVNGMPTNGISRPANGFYRPMPQTPPGPQFPVMRGNAGVRLPVGEPRVVRPAPQPSPMPRPMPQATPQAMPIHPQPAAGAPSTRSVHPAGAVNNPAAGNGHR